MPIIDEVDEGCDYTPPVKNYPEEYKGVTVDTREVPHEALLTHIEGYASQCDFYSQITSRDSGVKGLQVDLNPVYQPLRLVRGLEIKITSPCVPSMNDSHEWTGTGTANFYGIEGLIPNVGDFFISDAGDGKEAFYTITKSVKKTMYRRSPYEIEFSITDMMDANIAKNIAERVVKTDFFRLDYLRDGYNPLVTPDDRDMIADLEDAYGRLIAFYFADFYSREHRTLIVPNQDHPTYDPFVTRFITKILPVDLHPALGDMTLYNVSMDQGTYEMTIWNCLERLDLKMLQIVAQEMGIVPVKQFFTPPMFNSVYYSKIGQVVYPSQFQTNVDEGYKKYRPRPSVEPYRVGSVRFRELKRQIPITDLITDTADGPYYTDADSRNSDIKAVTDDSYYVFSEEFYNHHVTKETLCRLELLTLTALKGEKLDLSKLLKITEGAMDWDNVERFYYFPVLFLLMQIYPRAI